MKSFKETINESKTLYSVLSFHKLGYFRGFASGYNKIDAGRIAVEESLEDGYFVIVTTDQNFRKIPSKFIESHYWVMSKDSDDFPVIYNAVNSNS